MIRTIKAISLWEPWATLIRLKVKVFETRSWETSYRGPLLICAAQRITPGSFVAHLYQSDRFWRAMSKLGIVDKYRAKQIAWGIFSKKYFSHGMAVALVNLKNCIPTNKLMVGPEHAIFGDFSPGRFAWELDSIQPIIPVSVTGRQKMFDVTVDVQFEETCGSLCS